MLADASISRADVSKGKHLAARPANGHMHTGRWPQRGAGKQRRQRRRDILAAGGRRRGGGPACGRRLGEEGRHRGEEGRRTIAAEERRGLRRGEEGLRGRHVGEGCRVGDEDARRGRGGWTSARPSSPTAGDSTARVSGRSDASERSGATRRRGAARCVGEEGRVGEGRGEERRRRGRARQGRTARFGGNS
jgi:hypothetical protein